MLNISQSMNNNYFYTVLHTSKVNNKHVLKVHYEMYNCTYIYIHNSQSQFESSHKNNPPDLGLNSNLVIV